MIEAMTPYISKAEVIELRELTELALDVMISAKGTAAEADVVAEALVGLAMKAFLTGRSSKKPT